jgi:hypothetical protein
VSQVSYAIVAITIRTTQPEWPAKREMGTQERWQTEPTTQPSKTTTSPFTLLDPGCHDLIDCLLRSDNYIPQVALGFNSRFTLFLVLVQIVLVEGRLHRIEVLVNLNSRLGLPFIDLAMQALDRAVDDIAEDPPFRSTQVGPPGSSCARRGCPCL